MSTGELRIQCAHRLEDAEVLWRALEMSGVALPYQRFDWVREQLEHIARYRSSRICVMSISGGDAANTGLAVFPLMIVQRRGVRVLQWIGDEHSNYLGGLWREDFLRSLTPADFLSLWTRVATALPAFDVVWLRQQALSWRGVESPFRWLGSRVAGANTYHHLIFPHHDWKTLAPTLRSKKARKRMRNEENRLSREALIRHRVLTTVADLDAYLPCLFAQRVERLAELGIKAEPAQGEYLALYRSMLLRSIEAGDENTTLMVLLADDEMIAGMIMFEWQRVMYPLLISMTSGRLRQWSPGEYLLRLMLQRACDRQLAMVDIGPGEQEYKTAWCNAQTPQFETVMGVTLRGELAAWGIRGALGGKRLVKNTPWIWNLVGRLRSVNARLKGIRA